MEADVGVLSFEDGRWGHKQMYAGGSQKLVKARKLILPQSFQKEYSLANSLILDF